MSSHSLTLAAHPAERASLFSAMSRGVVVTAGAGLALIALLGCWTVLYTNQPPGYAVIYGDSPESAALFRALWAYPIVELQPSTFGRLAALLVVALWATYLAAWAVVRRARSESRRQLTLVVAGLALIIQVGLVLAMPPTLSSDIHHYALFGRMVALYDLNPYLVPGTVVASDPFWALAGWRDVTTHYGPLWTLLSAGLSLLGAQSMLLTLLLFKGTAALFNLANCLLVFLLARRWGADGTSALLLYAWNPLILIETAGNGHNDVAMMTFALLGLLLAARGRPVLGFGALALSVLTKYLTALLLLFYVVAVLARQPDRRQATGLAVRMGAVLAGLVVTLFLPFWGGPQTFDRLTNVGAPFKSVTRIVLRDRLAALLAADGTFAQTQAALEPLIIAGLHLGFAVLVLWLARRALRDRPDWPRLLELWGLAGLVYVTIVYGWNLPWLLVPALATTCVALQTRASYRLLGVSHALGLLLMLPYALLVRVG